MVSWSTELVIFCNYHPIFAFVLSSFVVVFIVLQGGRNVAPTCSTSLELTSGKNENNAPIDVKLTLLAVASLFTRLLVWVTEN